MGQSDPEYTEGFWEVLIAILIYLVVTFYLFVFRLSVNMFRHYKERLIARLYLYDEFDRNRHSERLGGG